MLDNRLVVQIPHRLTQEAAAQRIRDGVDQLGQRYGDRISALETSWNGYSMDMSVKALGAKVDGTIEVRPTDVVVTIQLPWLLAMLKDKITGFVTEKGGKLLQLK